MNRINPETLELIVTDKLSPNERFLLLIALLDFCFDGSEEEIIRFIDSWKADLGLTNISLN